MLIRGSVTGGFLVVRITAGGEVRTNGKVSFYNGTTRFETIGSAWTEERAKAQNFPVLDEPLTKLAQVLPVGSKDRVMILPEFVVDDLAKWVEDHRYLLRRKHREQRNAKPATSKGKRP